MPPPQASQCRASAAHPIELPTRRIAMRFLQSLIVVILSVCLPLQAVSAAVTAMLGARHTHQGPVGEQVVANGSRDLNDLMVGWRDFRRMQYGDAHSHLHERAHALGMRHHHQFDDASVVKDDASSFSGGGAPTEATQVSASFLFMAANGALDLPPSPEAFGVPWDAARCVVPGNPDPWRIERPPQSLTA